MILITALLFFRPDNFPPRNDYLKGKEFIQKYLFAFAFENQNCPDYITEKLFRPLMAGSVPIVCVLVWGQALL